MIICALNEAESVARVVAGVPSEIQGMPTTVIVVDDGSTDGTGKVASAAGAMVLRHGQNLGHGTSIRHGIAWAAEHGFEFAVLLDADGQHDPAEIPTVVRDVISGEADLVVGSRVLGQAYHTSLLRRIGVTFFAVVTRTLFRVSLTDSSSGFRAFRLDRIASLELRCVRHAPAEMNLAAGLHGFRIIEVPITVYPREHGQSRMGGDVRMAFDYVTEMVRAYAYHRRLIRERRAGRAADS